MMAVNMTAYPSVRKPALDALDPIELEFARDRVRYDELAPMLLNEMQQQQSKMAAQDAKIGDLEHQLAALTDLKQQVAVLTSAIQKLHAKDELIAQR
jgi:hypothetical protein